MSYESIKKWRGDNKDKIREYNKIYQYKNKDKLKEYRKQYYRSLHPKISTQEYIYRLWLSDYDNIKLKLPELKGKQEILQLLIKIEEDKKINNADYIMNIPDI